MAGCNSYGAGTAEYNVLYPHFGNGDMGGRVTNVIGGVCGRTWGLSPPNADAPTIFFLANMCHNVLFSTFLMLSSGTINLMHYTVSIIIRTCNQNED